MGRKLEGAATLAAWGLLTAALVFALVLLALVAGSAATAQISIDADAVLNTASVTHSVEIGKSAQGIATLSDRRSPTDRLQVEGDKIIISDSVDASGGWYLFITQQLREVTGGGALYAWFDGGARERVKHEERGSLTYLYVPHFSNVTIGTTNGSYTITWNSPANHTALWFDYNPLGQAPLEGWHLIQGANTTQETALNPYWNGTLTNISIDGGSLGLNSTGGPGSALLNWFGFEPAEGHANGQNIVGTDSWTLTSGAGDEWKASNDQALNGTLSAQHTDAAQSKIRHNVATSARYTTFGFYMYAEDGSNSPRLHVDGSAGSEAVTIQRYSSTGNFSYVGTGGSNTDTNVPFNINTWYFVEAELDYTADTFSIWIDGAEVVIDFGFRNNKADCGYFILNAAGTTNGAYVDDFKIFEGERSAVAWNETISYLTAGEFVSDAIQPGYNTTFNNLTFQAAACPAGTDYSPAYRLYNGVAWGAWEWLGLNITNTTLINWELEAVGEGIQIKILFNGTNASAAQVSLSAVNYTRCVEALQWSADNTTFTPAGDAHIFQGESVYINFTLYLGAWMENITLAWASGGAAPLSLVFNATWGTTVSGEWTRAAHIEWFNFTVELAASNDTGLVNVTWPASTDDFYSDTGRVYDGAYNNTSFFFNTSSFGWELEPGAHVANVSRNWNNAPTGPTVTDLTLTVGEGFTWSHACTDAEGNTLSYLTDWGNDETSSSASGTYGYTWTGTYTIICYCEETNAAYAPQNVSTTYSAEVSAAAVPTARPALTPLPASSASEWLGVGGPGTMWGALNLEPGVLFVIALGIFICGALLLYAGFTIGPWPPWVIAAIVVFIISFDAFGILHLADVWDGVGGWLDNTLGNSTG